MLEQVQKLYDEIYMNLKEYLQKKSVYRPEVFKDAPQIKKFPIVIIKLLPYTVEYTTKKYTDEIYHYGLETNIYAMQLNDTAKQTIANEISNHIEHFFKEEYRMTTKVSKNVPNEDESVARDIVQSMCLLDTKYKNKLVIYPAYNER